jgi:type I restriction enzyme S subunit
MSNPQLRWHLECRAIKAAQPGLNQKDLASIPIIIPPQEIVNKFTERVAILFDYIFEDAKVSRQYSNVRDVLVQRLITGELENRE